MTWQEYQLSRRYLFESHIGTRQRESVYRAQAEEDAMFERSKKALKGVK
jgi:hypothetical protein